MSFQFSSVQLRRSVGAFSYAVCFTPRVLVLLYS